MTSLGVLGTVRACQQENGLRHRDYRRYRMYCTRRLARLRAAVDLKQSGKNKKAGFVERVPSAEDCARDARCLLVVLMSAERAWGLGMELKDDNQQSDHAEGVVELRRRVHYVKRLSKAALWAERLRDLCLASGCDARTELEAEAYFAWMSGTALLEKEDWKGAFLALDKAKTVYAELSKAWSSGDGQYFYEERVGEIEPSLRFCSYSLSRESGPGGASADALAHLLRQSGLKGSEVLQDKLRKMLGEQVGGGGGGEERAVLWKGERVAVRAGAVQSKLLEVSEQRAAVMAFVVGGKKNEEEDEAVEEALLGLIGAVESCARVVQEEGLRFEKQASAGSVDKVVREFGHVLSYCRSVKLHVLVFRDVWRAGRQEAKEAGKAGGAGADGAQGVVAAYERALRSARELGKLCGGESGPTQDPAHDLSGAQVEALAAALEVKKMYWVGVWHACTRRWTQAIALFSRCVDANEVGEEPEVGEGEGASQEQKRLVRETVLAARQQRCVAQAKAFLQKAGDSTAVIEEGGDLCELPPKIRAVPCQPIVVDAAALLADPGPATRVPAVTKKAAAPEAGASGGGWLSKWL